MSYCNWEKTSIENQKYHNQEWGIPVHDDRTQFEYLMMEVMQCGLSWDIVIKKREIFRACFDNFEFPHQFSFHTQQMQPQLQP